MISVAISYFNRKKHLINTLKSMEKSKVQDFEVIVVDDCSNDENRIESLENEFKFLKVIRINPSEKKHVNPCIPFNMAISRTVGDIIILQNPECLHYDDVFEHATKNIEKNKYLAYSTINKDVVDLFNNFDWINGNPKNIINIDFMDNSKNHWYCHRLFRPEAYNFCSAILREDLKELNGFDERYADGIERDDVEFLDRIKRKKMEIVFVDNVIVIHQTHTPFYYKNPNITNLRNKNHYLYSVTTKIENIIRANPNKQILI